MSRVYSYELMPINFVMLPQAKQEDLINRFCQLLNSLSNRVRILVYRGSRNIDIGSASFNMEYYSSSLRAIMNP